MSDWDAVRYHRLSDPQLGWARAVAARLQPVAGERILDVGCGTGRLTAEMASTPGIMIVGLDLSFAMLTQARQAHRLRLVRGDGAALPFSGTFDAVFSAATFHWIPDHDRLVASLHEALKPGGRLVAQSGGGPNLSRLYERAGRLQESPEYSAWFASWSAPWRFEGVAATEARLARAGFTAIEVSLVPAPIAFDSGGAYAEFVECVCLRPQLDRLPPAARGAFVAELTRQAAADDPAYTLDYWRLNMSGRRRDA
jgi:trans-aconitate methyltransferase